MIDPHDIDVAMSAKQTSREPSSISASKWSPCDRKLWLGFRMASPVHFPAQTLRTFDIGHALEDSMVKWLESTGAKVGMREERLKNRYGTTLGLIDGIVVKEGEFMLLEMKTTKNKKFREWLKKGVPDNYFAQVNLYMHASRQLSQKGNMLTKCLFVVVNKDTSEIHTEVVDYDHVYAEGQTFRVENLIASDAYPAPQKDWTCSFCDHKAVCEGEVLPEINCRTCAMVSVENGVFTCPFGDSVCERHVFHPQIMEGMGYTMQSVDNETMVVEYQDFCMGVPGASHPTKPVFNSFEMKRSLDMRLLEDPTYMAICATFDARPVDGDVHQF